MFCWVVESIVEPLSTLLLCPLDMGMKYSRRRKIMEIVQQERGENKEMPKTDTLDALQGEREFIFIKYNKEVGTTRSSR